MDTPFEHTRTELLYSSPSPDFGERFDRVLAEHQADGWELVSAIDLEGECKIHVIHFVWKRPQPGSISTPPPDAPKRMCARCGVIHPYSTDRRGQIRVKSHDCPHGQRCAALGRFPGGDHRLDPTLPYCDQCRARDAHMRATQ